MDNPDPYHRSDVKRSPRFSLRDLGFVVTIAGLLFALVVTNFQTQTQLQSQIDGLQSRIDQTEIWQDKRERLLIGQLKIGDDISAHPDFLILADDQLDDSHELRMPFLKWQYECEDCTGFQDHVIYVFSLEFDRIEGVNEFYVVVVSNRIDRIVTGEAVCS